MNVLTYGIIIYTYYTCVCNDHGSQSNMELNESYYYSNIYPTQPQTAGVIPPSSEHGHQGSHYYSNIYPTQPQHQQQEPVQQYTRLYQTIDYAEPYEIPEDSEPEVIDLEIESDDECEQYKKSKEAKSHRDPKHPKTKIHCRILYLKKGGRKYATKYASIEGITCVLERYEPYQHHGFSKVVDVDKTIYQCEKPQYIIEAIVETNIDTKERKTYGKLKNGEIVCIRDELISFESDDATNGSNQKDLKGITEKSFDSTSDTKRLIHISLDVEKKKRNLNTTYIFINGMNFILEKYVAYNNSCYWRVKQNCNIIYECEKHNYIVEAVVETKVSTNERRMKVVLNSGEIVCIEKELVDPVTLLEIEYNKGKNKSDKTPKCVPLDIDIKRKINNIKYTSIRSINLILEMFKPYRNSGINRVKRGNQTIYQCKKTDYIVGIIVEIKIKENKRLIFIKLHSGVTLCIEEKFVQTDQGQMGEIIKTPKLPNGIRSHVPKRISNITLDISKKRNQSRSRYKSIKTTYLILESFVSYKCHAFSKVMDNENLIYKCEKPNYAFEVIIETYTIKNYRKIFIKLISDEIVCIDEKNKEQRIQLYEHYEPEEPPEPEDIDLEIESDYEWEKYKKTESHEKQPVQKLLSRTIAINKKKGNFGAIYRSIRGMNVILQKFSPHRNVGFAKIMDDDKLLYKCKGNKHALEVIVFTNINNKEEKVKILLNTGEIVVIENVKLNPQITEDSHESTVFKASRLLSIDINKKNQYKTKYKSIEGFGFILEDYEPYRSYGFRTVKEGEEMIYNCEKHNLIARVIIETNVKENVRKVMIKLDTGEIVCIETQNIQQYIGLYQTIVHAEPYEIPDDLEPEVIDLEIESDDENRRYKRPKCVSLNIGAKKHQHNIKRTSINLFDLMLEKYEPYKNNIITSVRDSDEIIYKCKKPKHIAEVVVETNIDKKERRVKIKLDHGEIVSINDAKYNHELTETREPDKDDINKPKATNRITLDINKRKQYKTMYTSIKGFDVLLEKFQPYKNYGFRNVKKGNKTIYRIEKHNNAVAVFVKTNIKEKEKEIYVKMDTGEIQNIEIECKSKKYGRIESKNIQYSVLYQTIDYAEPYEEPEDSEPEGIDLEIESDDDEPVCKKRKTDKQLDDK